MPVSGMGVAMATSGVVLMLSGIRNDPVADTLKSLLSGKIPPANPTGPPSVGVAPDATDQGSSPGSAAPGNTGAASTNAKANQALAKTLAIAQGHPTWVTGTEWADWVSLWNQESGWSSTADNPSSGAYGIPQALPYTKMPKAAWPKSAGGSSSASAQISWGIGYIASTYGSPSAAWAHEKANNWY